MRVCAGCQPGSTGTGHTVHNTNCPRREEMVVQKKKSSTIAKRGRNFNPHTKHASTLTRRLIVVSHSAHSPLLYAER